VESPLDAFKIGADVRAMQDQVGKENARYRRTNEHILAVVGAWTVYQKYQAARHR